MDKDIVPDNGRSEYASTPFGGDAETTTHVQPVPPDMDSATVLPGEQPDPRC